LDFIAIVCPQEQHLLVGLHAFSNYPQVEGLCHADDRGCDRGVIWIYHALLPGELRAQGELAF